eukprot:6193445-Pleurochrysis_carterae.AAC.2
MVHIRSQNCGQWCVPRSGELTACVVPLARRGCCCVSRRCFGSSKRRTKSTCAQRERTHQARARKSKRERHREPRGGLGHG